jgi:hypothetical protein
VCFHFRFVGRIKSAPHSGSLLTKGRLRAAPDRKAEPTTMRISQIVRSHGFAAAQAEKYAAETD